MDRGKVFSQLGSSRVYNYALLPLCILQLIYTILFQGAFPDSRVGGGGISTPGAFATAAASAFVTPANVKPNGPIASVDPKGGKLKMDKLIEDVAKKMPQLTR